MQCAPGDAPEPKTAPEAEPEAEPPAEDTAQDCDGPRRPCRRHAAGEDPAKRDQIMAGAMKAFLDKGFDATSVNDICRAARVSKGTLYVYFADKQDLFVALVAEQREKMFGGVDAVLRSDLPLAEKLTRFGRQLAEIVTSDHVVQWQRTIAGIVDRMPELGVRFYDAGALRTHTDLTDLLRREVAAGRLDLPDPVLASAQFIDLSGAGIWRARLFGKRPTPPGPDEIERTVDSAVRLFLAAYARPGARRED
ncbi:TetR/AcrR family transcriptional regulator [Rhodovulum sulfidophilum]|uniref:TetR/AcrR family transcriptional regulator n=1 Tax=Rhodovulum sulfidophilum TaxID=35806 RepID=UPI0009D67AE5|nr:TetR/AcrR family transcriptional regulator [Rhodovulum sulfidophilum]